MNEHKKDVVNKVVEFLKILNNYEKSVEAYYVEKAFEQYGYQTKQKS